MTLETSWGDWTSSLKDLQVDEYLHDFFGLCPTKPRKKMIGITSFNFELSKSSQLKV